MDWTPEFSRSFQSLRAAAKRKMMTSKASRRNYRHLDYRDTIEIQWDRSGSIESEQLTLSSQWMKLAQKVLARQEHPVAAKAFSPTTGNEKS